MTRHPALQISTAAADHFGREFVAKYNLEVISDEEMAEEKARQRAFEEFEG